MNSKYERLVSEVMEKCKDIYSEADWISDIVYSRDYVEILASFVYKLGEIESMLEDLRTEID